MKDKIKILISLLFISGIMCACVTNRTTVKSDGADTSTDNAMIENTSSSNVAEKLAFEPFYVYEDFKSSKNHYAPSGWMGDIASLKMFIDNEQNVHDGKYCIKLEYTPSQIKQWAGIYWQHPVNNWGDKKGGYDLTGATKLTFWARGEEGREVLSEVKIGGISGVYSDSDVAWLKGVKLSRTWKKFTIDLSKADLSSISGGFCVVFSKKDNPVSSIVYLDDIRYE